MSSIKELKQVKLKIDHGEIQIDENAAHILIENPDVVVISISMGSKYVDIVGYHGGSMRGVECVSGPGLILGANDRTRYKNPAHEKFTTLEFPEYVGWDCISADTGRYDVIAVLVNKKALYGEDG